MEYKNNQLADNANQFFAGKKVLVTGAAGFIGSRLVQRLIESGAQVRAFTRYTSRPEFGNLVLLPPESFSQIEIVRGDLEDNSAVDAAVVGCEIVFHLGALISIPYSYVHPVETARTNIIGTLNMLESCRNHQVKLVHTSTSEVYGTALRVPIDEEHPLQAQSPYSASKIGADKLVESYHRSFDLPSLTVRPFNTYGPGQSNRAVIPTIITQALTSNQIHLGNLDTKRDFTYLDDTVEGFLKAAINGKWDGQVYNLGTGIEVTIGEVAQKIFDYLQKQPEIIIDQERLRPEKSEVFRLVSDNSKARQEIDWQPQVSLEQGLAKTVEWIRRHPDHYQPGIYGR
ncbi:MAG: NAD-dependent epimerase/dehydratase family protein [Chloroflexi bacterium]|nr:NAD-dependent epimerase/dehydratase family protein [Chloroflexota bacterium]